MLLCSVAQLPIETPLRRRARESNLVSLSSRDDPVLEEYLHLIHQGAQLFDKSSERKRQMHFSGSDEPIQKQLVFYQPHFGIVLRREVDAFGFNPVVIVYAIAPESPAAGLIGVGDQLIAVDDKPMTYVSQMCT